MATTIFQALNHQLRANGISELIRGLEYAIGTTGNHPQSIILTLINEKLELHAMPEQGRVGSLTQQTHRHQDNLKTKMHQLSNHEISILKLIASHKTSKEIAAELFISPKTVANHRTNIARKLGLSGEQNSLLKWAIENKELLV
jgi:DNA-binding CsgD family transcriptional regulator